MKTERFNAEVLMTDGPYRDGDLLVVDEGAALPVRCPVCNGEAEGEPLSVRFITRRGENGVQRALLKLNDIARGWNYTGPVDVSMHFCAAHRGRRKQAAVALGVVLAVGAALTPFAVLYGSKDTPVLNGAAGLPVIVGVMGLVMLAGGHLNP